MMLFNCRCRCPGDPPPPLPPPPGGWVTGGCERRCRSRLMPAQFTVSFPWNPAIRGPEWSSNAPYIASNGNLIAENYKNKSWVVKKNNPADCIYRSDEPAWTWEPSNSNRVHATPLELPGTSICQMSMGSEYALGSAFIMTVTISVVSQFITGSWPHYYPIGGMGLQYSATILQTTDPLTGRRGINCNSVFTLSNAEARRNNSYGSSGERWAFYGAEFQTFGYPNYPWVVGAYSNPVTPVPATIQVVPS